MSTFENLTQLLHDNGYIVYEYYSYENYCIFIKIIHFSGSYFFINISSKYKISIPSDTKNHFHIEKDMQNVKNIKFQDLYENYPTIELSNDIYIRNISENLQTTYKQPIDINTYKSHICIEQMLRFRHSFKSLEYKLLIQDQSTIVVLNRENKIIVYTIKNHNLSKERTYYILATLEQLFIERNKIHIIINQIEEQFYKILDLNQKKHNHYLNTTYIQHFIANNNLLLINKNKILTTKKEIETVLLNLNTSELKFKEELKIVNKKTNHNIFNDAENSVQKELIQHKLKRIQTLKLELLDKLIFLNTKIKDIYLIIDQLGFNLSLALNELRNEIGIMLKDGNV